MRRRDFIAMIGSAATASIASPVPLGAQQARNVPRVGYLATNSLETPQARRVVDALVQGLREHGYVEGRNIVIIAGQTGTSSASRAWRSSWSASRSMSLSHRIRS